MMLEGFPNKGLGAQGGTRPSSVLSRGTVLPRFGVEAGAEDECDDNDGHAQQGKCTDGFAEKNVAVDDC